jgi:hypothetical protein
MAGPFRLSVTARGSPVRIFTICRTHAANMLNRKIKVLAAIIVVLSAGAYSQAIRVDDQSSLSISSDPCSHDDEDQSAAADDDSDDGFNDFVMLDCTLDWLPSDTAIPHSLGGEPIIGSSYLSTSATLKSKHILLRV